MYSFSGSPSGADSVRASKRGAVEIDPLALFESQSTGREFEAFVPEARGRREIEMRRNETIVKNWRASAGSSSSSSSCMTSSSANSYGSSSSATASADESSRAEGRERRSIMRNLEAKQFVNGERLFLKVLTFMILTLGSLLAFFVHNFHF
jgi:hypothetical protein